jgi:AcrR family transcriptional regulator
MPSATGPRCWTPPGRCSKQGLEAPLEEIALRAGVGIGTLYRRFPTRTQLVAAALFDKVAQYAEAAEQALAISDPW